MKWKEYETHVFNYFKSRHPYANVRKNVQLDGKLSGVSREIDILIDNQFFGHAFQIAIECKNWNSVLDVADIAALIDKMKDVGINNSILVSRLGYSEAARRRVKAEIGFQLQVLDFDNLPAYCGFWGAAYRGNVCAIISPPNGWLVNTKIDKSNYLHMVCWLHPFEFSYQISANRKLLISFQIRPMKPKTLLAEYFDEWCESISSELKDAKVISWTEKVYKDANRARIIEYRTLETKTLDTTIYFGGFQTDDWYTYCTFPANIVKDNDELTKVRYVLSEVDLIALPDVDPTNSRDIWDKILARTFTMTHYI